ncbi:glycosyl hydrolase family 3 C-terminal domain-containing protein [Obelidium mucronatum]|nr:glycosyl hydrolase family 3 C-terminal domain-containing protein [Obelidium mucronatum]
MGVGGSVLTGYYFPSSGKEDLALETLFLSIRSDSKDLCLQDSPMGVQQGTNVTAFPSGLNVAATLDKDLMEEYGKALGKEFRALGINVFTSLLSRVKPLLNTLDKIKGSIRVQVLTFYALQQAGGDPYLASISSSLIVRGIQSNGVIATAKHLIGNEQEMFRERSSSNIDKKTLMEVYMAPFDVKESNIFQFQLPNIGLNDYTIKNRHASEKESGAIMCSYNKLNGIYTCANSELVNGIIKSPDLDFRSENPSGMVEMDAVSLSYSYSSDNFSPHIKQFPDDRLDDMVTRILSTYYHFGQDIGFPNTTVDTFTEKKKGDSTSLKLAILGEDARAPKLLNEFPIHQGMDGTLAQGWGSGTALFPYLISGYFYFFFISAEWNLFFFAELKPFEGISERAVESKISSMFDNNDIHQAQQLANEANVAIVFGSANSGELILAAMNFVEGNWGDRNDLKLWHNADALIEAVAAVNKQTIVVLHTVGPVDMPWFNHPNITAVIYALLPGQESGSALADILFGDSNPSGRLPFTVFENRTQYAADVQYWSHQLTPQIDYSEGLYIDYRHAERFNITSVIPFGHGLSYTRFQYSDLQVSTIVPHDSSTEFPDIHVSVLIENKGHVPGHEIVQLYIAYPEPAGQPKQILKGFEKVWVEVGKFVMVEFHLTPRDLRVWDTVLDGKLVPVAHIQARLLERASEAPNSAPVIATNTLVTGLGLTANDVHVSHEHFDADTGLHHVHFTEIFQGLPIANAVANVNLDASGSVVSIFQSFPPSKVVRRAARGVRDGSPNISIIQAIGIFAKAKGLPFTDDLVELNLQEFPSKLQKSTTKPPKALLNVFVDSKTGIVVGATRWKYDFTERSDTPDSSYTVLPIGAMDPSKSRFIKVKNPADLRASPLGWHSGTDLTGPNARVRSDPTYVDDVDTLYYAPGNISDPNLNFNFKFDATKGTDFPSNINAANTNAFYVTNAYHDILYGYGFTEAAGNFQDQDPVLVLTQSGQHSTPPYRCNAGFYVGPDGFHGIVEVYVCAKSDPDRDLSLDNGMLIHELTHGLSNRLTGGARDGNCLETLASGGLGEGRFHTSK